MNFTPFPTLRTERLILRKTTKNDLEDLLFLRSDEEMNQFIKRKVPKNLEEVSVFLDNISAQIHNNESIYWSITLKKNTKMIGSICLWNFSKDRKKAEVGYDLKPTFQQQGIMDEALRAVLKFGFHHLVLDEIAAFTHRLNEGSKKLLLKNNFTFIHDEKDEHNADNLIFKLNKSLYLQH